MAQKFSVAGGIPSRRQLQHLLARGCLLFVTFSLSDAFALAEPAIVQSPNERIEAAWRLDEQRRLHLDIAYRGHRVARMQLGLDLAESGKLPSNLQVAEVDREDRDHTYAIAVGKSSMARDRHREVAVGLRETEPPGRELKIVLRVFNEGVAMRYVLPEQSSLDQFVLLEEMTSWQFAGNSTSYVLPLRSYQTSYEAYYEKTTLGALSPDQLYGLPLLLQHPTAAGPPVWLAMTEANLTDYAGMYVSAVDGSPGVLQSKLSPLPDREDQAKVLGKAPHASPWRVLMLGDDPSDLLESQIIFHLSDPCAVDDVSWIRPGKTTFPWWNHYVLEGVDFEPGVNTETAKHYIDFCAEQGIEYHSLDGLDIAWYGGPIQPVGPTDVTTAAASIDLPEVLRYAREKGVRLRLWMHWKALRPQIDEAFAAYEQWGIEGRDPTERRLRGPFDAAMSKPAYGATTLRPTPRWASWRAAVASGRPNRLLDGRSSVL